MNIQKELKKADTFEQAEAIAEKLTYEISYQHKEDTWRTRYDSLYAEDFEKLGWTVYCIATKKDNFRQSLVDKGYVYLNKSYNNINEKILYKKESKTMFQIGDYGSGESVSISYDKIEELITLDEYRLILLARLEALVIKKTELRDFIKGLIDKADKLRLEELEEYKREEIIEQALEEAKKKGLIV